MPQAYKRIQINGKRQPLHRYIMEQHLGRELLSNEVVHHVNGDRYDNRIENLQVMTVQEHHKLHHQKYSMTATCLICGKEFRPTGAHRKNPRTCSNECRYELLRIYAAKRKKPVIQFDLDGNFIKLWNSAKDAEVALGIHRAGISGCCLHKYPTAYGFRWEFAEEVSE